eukprot:7427228-Pyramimonas_sp.AAC.1
MAGQAEGRRERESPHPFGVAACVALARWRATSEAREECGRVGARRRGRVARRDGGAPELRLGVPLSALYEIGPPAEAQARVRPREAPLYIGEHTVSDESYCSSDQHPHGQLRLTCKVN